ncbi:uncharacterized protein LOC111396954 [Olea europaea var. sylvestris]|uniref:uncharacterized protein LOC111396954 n=1 Tax=Olea europaea var. sylvestris TaxID=158386 RepID=UPI000C1D63CD|nr:uncharacterized protein LOC111396954 [Olea europaea var. sylvestris]
MSRFRVNSSPELAAPSTSEQYYDDSALEGVAANVKLLLKLIQDHKDACNKEKKDGRRMLRVATMMTILDNVRTRIQKCQSFGNKTSEVEMWRCNTDLKPNHVPRDKKQGEPIADEKERLRKELNASLAARKSLEIMCSSLGKEKEIMAAELSRKVHELNGIEELVSDLKAQNESLLEKVQERALDHEERGGNRGETQGNLDLQERNKVLSEQLLRSLDGYRSMKRKLKEAREEYVGMRSTMDEMGAKAKTSLNRVRSFKERMASGSNPPVDVQEEIVALEHMFECFQMMVEKHEQKKGECLRTKGEINTCKPSVLA